MHRGDIRRFERIGQHAHSNAAGSELSKVLRPCLGRDEIGRDKVKFLRWLTQDLPKLMRNERLWGRFVQALRGNVADHPCLRPFEGQRTLRDLLRDRQIAQRVHKFGSSWVALDRQCLTLEFVELVDTDVRNNPVNWIGRGARPIAVEVL